jgi:class 3 adenylate cyclase
VGTLLAKVVKLKIILITHRTRYMNDLFPQLDLSFQTTLSQEQHRFIVMISVIGSVTALYHGLVIPLFLWMGLVKLAWFNVFSVIAWCLVVLLARQGMLYLPALLIVAEIGGYVALCTRYIGWESGAPFLLFNLGWAAFAIPINQWSRLLGIAVALLEFVILYFTSTRVAWNGALSVIELIWLSNVATVFAFGILTAAYLFRLVRKAEKAQQEAFFLSETLLHNVLPPTIAGRLKQSNSVIADCFSDASVLFADIEGFTPLSQRMTPVELVQMLNDLFSRIDDLVRNHGLEKIKTIGDAYMVAAGIPDRRNDHADAIVAFAFELQETLSLFNRETGRDLRLRIGINSGPVTAGVIGRHRFHCDLWGDSVNTAARMESHGLPDEIHITEETRRLLKGGCCFEERGMIPVKGKGDMRTYFLRRPVPTG